MTASLRSSYVRLAVLSAVAATVAFVVADLLPFADPIPATITAAVGVRVTFHHAAKESVISTVAALLGGAIGLLVAWLVGSAPVVILLLVLLSFVLARLLRVGTRDDAPFIAANMAVTMILVVGTHLTTEGAVERFVGVAIGALCALAASALAGPRSQTALLFREIDALQDDLAALLTDVSRGLRHAPDADEAQAWRSRAVELRDRSLGLAAKVADLKSNRRWSPLLDADDLADLTKRVDATSVMASRVLSIASDLAAATRGQVAGGVPSAARSPLADLIAMAAENIAADDPTGTIGRTEAGQAVRVADQTAQIALVGGIVSNINRITLAASEGHDPDEDHSPT